MIRRQVTTGTAALCAALILASFAVRPAYAETSGTKIISTGKSTEEESGTGGSSEARMKGFSDAMRSQGVGTSTARPSSSGTAAAQSTGTQGSTAGYAASSEEDARMKSFSGTLQSAGISGSVKSSGKVVSTGSGNVIYGEAADPRLQSLYSQAKSIAPAVKDVVIQTRRPWQEEDSAYVEQDLPGQAVQYETLEKSDLTDEWIRAGLLQGSVTGTNAGSTVSAGYHSEPNITGTSGSGAVSTGYRSEPDGIFPSTDWRKFGTELVDLGTFTLTAYDPCLQCCGKTDGITATGTKGMAGRTIAVDPDVIPYGSLVVIGGYVFVAEDTGEAIRGNHIDMFMDAHETAKQFGVREAQVLLIR